MCVKMSVFSIISSSIHVKHDVVLKTSEPTQTRPGCFVQMFAWPGKIGIDEIWLYAIKCLQEQFIFKILVGIWFLGATDVT